MKDKLRIIHIIPSLAKGGAERLVLDICNSLNNSNEVDLILITFSKTNDYHFLSKTINHKIITASVRLSLWKPNIININALENFIKTFNPHIIHLHLFEAVFVLSQIKNIKASVFIHFHNNMKQFNNFSLKNFSKETFTNFLEKKIILSAYKKTDTHYIAISKDTLLFLEKNLPKKSPKILLYNAINLNRFKQLNQIKVNSEKLRLISTGSLLLNKGHELAIDIVSELIKLKLAVSLTILGEGPNRENLEHQIKLLKLDNEIKLIGKVDFPENYLMHADIYLHTAYHEAFGLAIVEAMAAKLPIICTDAFGNRDLIENGLNGYLIANRNPEIFAKKIAELFKDHLLREKMGEKSALMAQQYDLELYSKKLLSIYRDARLKTSHQSANSL